MTIKTKFQVGDKVFVIEKGRVATKTVKDIRIKVRQDEDQMGIPYPEERSAGMLDIQIRYTFNGDDGGTLLESAVFSSRQELIDNL